MEMITPGTHTVLYLSSVIGNIHNFKLVSYYHCLLVSQTDRMLVSKPNHENLCQKEIRVLVLGSGYFLCLAATVWVELQ